MRCTWCIKASPKDAVSFTNKTRWAERGYVKSWKILRTRQAMNVHDSEFATGLVSFFQDRWFRVVYIQSQGMQATNWPSRRLGASAGVVVMYEISMFRYLWIDVTYGQMYRPPSLSSSLLIFEGRGVHGLPCASCERSNAGA